MGLKEFPNFSTETALFKALRDQGFDVGPRTKNAARRIANNSGGSVFVHPDSIVGRSGHRAANGLKALVAIGFVPPAEYERQTKAFLEATGVPVEKEQAPEPPAPVPEDVDFPCPECVVARCAKCEDQEQPCTFPFPRNLGRHRSAMHGVAGQSRPTGQGASGRSGRVRIRTDPSVIKDPFARLSKELMRRMTAMNDTVGQLMILAAEHESELIALRRFKKEVEDQTGRLYDITTRPNKG